MLRWVRTMLVIVSLVMVLLVRIISVIIKLVIVLFVRTMLIMVLLVRMILVMIGDVVRPNVIGQVYFLLLQVCMTQKVMSFGFQLVNLLVVLLLVSFL